MIDELRPPTWQADAACAGQDTDVWFTHDDQLQRTAVAVCHRCPVRTECLTEALHHGIDQGIWGGLTTDERRAYARRLVRRAS